MSHQNAKIYFEKISEIARRCLNDQEDELLKLSKKICDSITSGGVIHAFGSGHSHCCVEEFFHRAGGLVPVNGILEPYLMPHSTPRLSGHLERQPGLAAVFLELYDLKKGEFIFVFSNSGINSISVDVATIAKEKGLHVVGVTSVAHSEREKSRHPSGKKLYEVSDTVIDTKVPHGDAVVEMRQSHLSVSPASGVISSMVVNTLVTLISQEMDHRGEELPVYLSANRAGGDEHNKKMEEKIRHRVRHLI